MAEAKEKLFSEFAPISTEEWMAKITADLKGVPFEKKLVWKTGEGFNANPFYRLEDLEGLKTTDSLPGEFPYVRGTKKNNDWYVRQNIEVDCPKAANEKALDVLEKGITSLGFIIKGDDVTPENIATLLDGICPACVELNFNTCLCKAEKLITILAAYFTSKGVDLAKCQGSVNYDPFKKPLIKGHKNENWVEMATAVLNAGKALPNYRVLAVNAFELNNAGAYIAQELGYALAWGNELLAKLTDAGFPVDEVAKKIKFNFGISSNYFMEIAKFRAARWLWAEIVKAYNPACDCACKMAVHAQTSQWNQTIFDAHVNLLRSQTEAMSAAIAGVDSITVRPFDEAYETPDATRWSIRVPVLIPSKYSPTQLPMSLGSSSSKPKRKADSARWLTPEKSKPLSMPPTKHAIKRWLPVKNRCWVRTNSRTSPKWQATKSRKKKAHVAAKASIITIAKTRA